MDRSYVEMEKILREKYLEACDEAKKEGLENGVYNVAKLRALCDMAKYDIYPDGRFSDVDCNVWSMFRERRVTVRCGVETHMTTT